MDKLLAIYKYR